MKKESEFTILMTLDSIEQAYIYQSLLESHGVACQIINATAQSVLRFDGLMWGIRLLVLTSQAELAYQIINSEFENQEWNESEMIENDENTLY